MHRHEQCRLLCPRLSHAVCRRSENDAWNRRGNKFIRRYRIGQNDHDRGCKYDRESPDRRREDLAGCTQEDANLIVIDPRRTEIAEHADIHLQIRPGTNIPLLNAMASVMIEEDLLDTVFIAERVLEMDEFRGFVTAYSPEKVAEICGVDAALIRKAARLYASAKPSMCFHGLGLTEHVQGTEGVMCVVNLALLTGNIGRPGTGVNPLRGQNNVQGAAQMGCDPGILTGSISLNDGRADFEKVWKATIPTGKGLDLMEMIDSAQNGELKALWSVGYDIFLTNPNTADTGHALRSLEFVVIQDMFMNETAREFGDVFLPAASSFEKDGTFMNAERRIQRVRKAIEPRGNSRSDWQIICDTARAMGKGEFLTTAALRISGTRSERFGRVRPASLMIGSPKTGCSGLAPPRIHLEPIFYIPTSLLMTNGPNFGEFITIRHLRRSLTNSPIY